MLKATIDALCRYCAYQERCHQEVKYKCLELGLRGEEVEEAIAMLIAENFLNEERYAKAFARGKFRIKHWGKNKIKAELKQRQLSDYCIRKGLAEIDGDDYYATLVKQADKKFQSLKGETAMKKRYKTMQYMLQRGFESALIAEALEEIANNEV